MEEKYSNKKVYKGLDLFKFISAIAIVILHTIETTDWLPCEFKYVFTRFAVPFFFITSGFFFYIGLNKADNKKKYLIKYEKNILKIFIAWSLIIYSPFVIKSYVELNQGEPVFKIILLLIRRIFVIGAGPYWYLVALMWSALFIYCCSKLKTDKLLYAGISIGLILEILYSCFSNALSNIFIFEKLFNLIYFVFSWEYNTIMFGIPFMGIGYLIAKNKLNISVRVSSVLLLISTIIGILEYNLLLISQIEFFKDNKISFAFMIQAIAVFMIAKNIEPNISFSTSKTLRQLSSIIYFSHAIILYEIMNPIMELFMTISVIDSRLIIPKAIIVTVLCIGLYFTIKKINNKYLNVLING